MVRRKPISIVVVVVLVVGCFRAVDIKRTSRRLFPSFIHLGRAKYLGIDNEHDNDDDND
jgi:hypothetical protein